MRINEKSYMNLAKKIQAMLEEEIERNTVTDQTKHVQHTVRISKKFMRLAALFYAINIPCSKLLLNNVAPIFMAVFLYLGAGLGVGIMYVFHAKKESRDERIGREDIPYTLAMVVLDAINKFCFLISQILSPQLLCLFTDLGTSFNIKILFTVFHFVHPFLQKTDLDGIISLPGLPSGNFP